jgi:hypothetical protein
VPQYEQVDEFGNPVQLPVPAIGMHPGQLVVLQPNDVPHAAQVLYTGVP